MAGALTNSSDETTRVGLAALGVSNAPGGLLVTQALGAGIGIAVYDPDLKAGGLLHAMLPDSSIDLLKAKVHPAMFVDTGLPALFHSMAQLGAEKGRLIVALVGAAQIIDQSGYFNIGRQNHEAAANLIRRHGLAVAAEDVGGLVNRTMSLSVATGEVRVRVSGQASETVLCGNSMNT